MHVKKTAPEPLKRAMTMKELCDYTGFSESYFRHAIIQGHRDNRIPPPPFIRIGRSLRFLKDDVDGWLERNRTVG